MSVTTVLEALGWIPVVWLLAVHTLHDRGRLPDHARSLRVAGFVAAATVVAGAVATRMWPLAALGVLWLRSEVFAHRHPAPAEPEIHWHEHTNDEDAHSHPGSVEPEVGPFSRPDVEPLAEPGVGDEVDIEPDVESDVESLSEPGVDPHSEPDLRPAFESVLRAEATEVVDDVRIHHGPAAVVHDHEIEPLPVRRSVPDQPRQRSPERAERDHLPAMVALRTRPPEHASQKSPGKVPAQRKATAPAKSRAGLANRLSWVLSILFKIEIVIAIVIVLVLFGIWSQHQRGTFNDRANHSLCNWMDNC
jgi:hypothetical protein